MKEKAKSVDDSEELARKVKEYFGMTDSEVRALDIKTLRSLASDGEESKASSDPYMSGEDIRELREFGRSIGVNPA